MVGERSGWKIPRLSAYSHGRACLDQLPIVRWKLPRAHARGGAEPGIPLSCPAVAISVPAEGYPRLLELYGWTLLSSSRLDAPGCPLPTLCQPQELSHTHQPLYCCARNHSSSKHWERGDTGGPRPHCQGDKPHKPPGEGVPRASWARASLVLRRGPGRAP